MPAPEDPKEVFTAESFKARFGRSPTEDDLHRVNCSNVGALGHWQCGMCPEHDKPRFVCGCTARHG